jgi:hypothetical protein
MPHDGGHKKIARVMFFIRANVLAHSARLLALAERWLLPADQLDYAIRRWLILVPVEDGTRSMPHKEASLRSSLRNVLMALLEQPDATLHDVLRIFSDNEFRKKNALGTSQVPCRVHRGASIFKPA